MKESFLDMLRCPHCFDRLELSVDSAQSGEILEGGLRSTCGSAFPIVRGVPRFVSSEEYAANFGFQWNVHKTTQFDTAKNPVSTETFQSKTRWHPNDLRGLRVLDVGVGSGRFADVVQRAGGTVVGVDISLAVDASFETVGRREHAHIVQADVFRLPFAPDSFDAIYSLGVLHHTPNTREAFLKLPPLLRPGGRIGIWVYSAYSTSPYPFINDLYRSITRRMPKRLLYAICQLAGPVGVLQYYFFRIVPFGRELLHMLLPGFVFHGMPKVGLKHDAAERILNTFDWYSPEYQFKHTFPEVSGWFEEAGLERIRVFDPQVSVCGYKPVATYFAA